MRTGHPKLVAAVVALAVLAASCGDDGSGGDLDTAAAAEGARAAIDQGDVLGECPMGTPEELVGAVEGGLPGDSRLIEEDVDDGQVYSGGDVPITYCTHADFGHAPELITELRLDASPGTDVAAGVWLDENFVHAADVEFEEVDDIAGGAAAVGCVPDEQVCHVVWQGADLFVAVTAVGNEAVAPEMAVDLAVDLVPVAVANLAA